MGKMDKTTEDEGKMVKTKRHENVGQTPLTTTVYKVFI